MRALFGHRRSQLKKRAAHTRTPSGVEAVTPRFCHGLGGGAAVALLLRGAAATLRQASCGTRSGRQGGGSSSATSRRRGYERQNSTVRKQPALFVCALRPRSREAEAHARQPQTLSLLPLRLLSARACAPKQLLDVLAIHAAVDARERGLQERERERESTHPTSLAGTTRLQTPQPTPTRQAGEQLKARRVTTSRSRAAEGARGAP